MSKGYIDYRDNDPKSFQIFKNYSWKSPKKPQELIKIPAPKKSQPKNNEKLIERIKTRPYYKQPTYLYQHQNHT